MSEIDNKTHVNYVVAFSDGTLKIGVTGRPRERLAEILRIKAKTSSAQLAQYACTQPCGKEQAFKTERDLCSLLANRGIDGHREWFEDGNYSLAMNFDYFKQTTQMFWLMNEYQGSVARGVSA